MNCDSISLQSIYMDCAASIGGIKKVWVAKYADFKSATVTAGTDGDEITAINMETDAQWYAYNFRKGTGSLTSTLTIEEANGINYVANDLNLVFTKMETVKRMNMVAMAIGQLVAIVLDSNGKYWFLGYDDYVSASQGAGNTGTAKGDMNAYTVTLSTESLEYPYEITEEAITALNLPE